ncbi:NACHT domain protein [Caballeronia cordobensis]|uniref:NACHT domain protein n=1 Tax=Caballeronia cordobensis TaxID=1353886 RepID=A0A158EQL4_CABCO|nr:NACHT domain-containing protein [Caballeronia cordobensis]SAL09845.1 NACHT domain protein [Caballeronia cordobensis]
MLAPLIKDLYNGAKGALSNKFKKWQGEQAPKKVAQKILMIGMVKTLWQVDKEVWLGNFYYPASIFSVSHEYRQLNSLADIQFQRIVIQGVVGQGKSMLLRHLCVQELTGRGSGKIPLFIELREIRGEKRLLSLILRELGNYGLVEDVDVFKYLAKTGRLALLLDGFDEIDIGNVPSVLEELEQLSFNFEDLTVVATSRPDCAIQHSAAFRRVYLSMLAQSDHLPFLTRLGLDRVHANDIATAIENSPSHVAELINTPLMLTLTVTVYRSEKSIPAELPEFFEALFTTVFTRHDRSKPGFVREHRTGLGERALQKLFEGFCFMAAQRSKTRTLTNEEFSSFFEKASHYFPETICSVESFKHDVSKVACLMLEDGIGEITFLHKSIAEYFAASFVRRQQERAAKKFYTAARECYREWQQVLRFLAVIDKYRYLKFYRIGIIEGFIERYDENNARAGDHRSKTLIKRTLWNVTLRYDRRNRPIPLREIRREALDSDEIDEILFDKFIDVLKEHVPARLSKGNEQVKIEPLISGLHERETQVTAIEMVNEIGFDSFIKIAEQFLTDLRKEVEIARASIAIEERNADIF